MPMLNSVAASITRRMPKAITPTGHAVVDYFMIVSFFVAGRLFWRRNKPASVSAFICGGGALALNLLTDYPGGITDSISMPAHTKMDLGLAAVAASMPEFMGFEKDRAKWLFLLESSGFTVLANLTSSSAQEAGYGGVRRAA